MTLCGTLGTKCSCVVEDTGGTEDR